MTPFDDDEDVRSDELLAGRAVPGPEPLAAVLGRLRALADEPAPAPTPALAAVLREGLPAAALDRPAAAAGTRPVVLRALRWATGLGVAGKILLGAGVAAAAVAGTATLPVVPDSVQAPVRAALTDLGHLIPGSAGGSVPVPSATTPEPVDGVAPPVDPPSAEPARGRLETSAPGHDEGSGPESRPTPRGRPGDQDEQQPDPASGSQGKAGEGNEQGDGTPRPSARASENAGGNAQGGNGQGSSGGNGQGG